MMTEMEKMENLNKVSHIDRRIKTMIREEDFDEFKHIVKKLAKTKVDVSILEDTNIGMTVQKARKILRPKNPKANKSARNLIKIWRNVVFNEDTDSGSESESEDERARSLQMIKAKRAKKDMKHSSPKASDKPAKCLKVDTGKKRVQTIRESSSSSEDDFADSERDHRKKAIKLLGKSMGIEGVGSGIKTKLRNIAKNIENHVYLEHNGCSKKYIARMRELAQNLQRNEDLRWNVTNEYVAAADFAVMSSNDMADPKLKKQREKFAKETLVGSIVRDAQASSHCPQCKAVKVNDIAESQPMARLISCEQCGHMWKPV